MRASTTRQQVTELVGTFVSRYKSTTSYSDTANARTEP